MTRVGSSEGVAVKISAQDYIGGVRVGLILLDSGRAHGRKWQSDFVSPPAGDRAPERIRRQDRTTPPTDVVMPNQRGAAEFGQEDERGEPDPEWRAVGAGSVASAAGVGGVKRARARYPDRRGSLRAPRGSQPEEAEEPGGGGATTGPAPPSRSPSARMPTLPQGSPPTPPGRRRARSRRCPLSPRDRLATGSVCVGLTVAA